MRAALIAILGASASTAMADPSTDFVENLVPALAKSANPATLVAKPPTGVTVTASGGGWQLAFPAIDTKHALARWKWHDIYAVSGDVHQRQFSLRRSTGSLSKDRIGTVDPNSGRWALRIRLVERPPGALPPVLAGASPAYPVPAYASKLDQLEIVPRDADDVAAAIKAIAKPTMADIERELGPPDHDIGSGIHVLEYALGTRSIRVGSPDLRAVMYVQLDGKDVYRK